MQPFSIIRPSLLRSKFHDDISNGSRVIALTNTDPQTDTTQNITTIATLLLRGW